MIKTLEKTGRTEDDAINAALAELGLDRDDVSVEILERAKSGFLGIGASPAVVRVSYEAEDEPAPAEENVVVETVEVEVSAPVADEPADYAAVRQFLTGLLDRMGVKANIAISARDNGGINVELSGSGMGAIIAARRSTRYSTSQTTLSTAAARNICTSALTPRITAASARNPSPSLPRRWRRRPSSISAAWLLSR